jgi:negative regulator of sigma E activity
MNEQRRFGESDHEALTEDDILKQAITEWRDELPSRDLWSGISARIETQQQPVVATQRFFRVTMAQMAVAASLLIAVASGVTWTIARQPVGSQAAGSQSVAEPVIQAYGAPDDEAGGQIVQANFADAQYNAAVSDLERILREERDRLDPRTVLIIERNLKAIDDAINEARTALDNDPANPYLNSHLADARRRKLDLLRHATSLASGGD